MNKLIVSLSPHVHGGDSVQRNMYGVCIALVPALLASLWFFGLGAAIVLATSVLACVLFEWAIAKFLLKSHRCTICDGSAVLTGLLLGFNLPSNLPLWIIIIGALVAIGVGKMTFGGLGCNPFNPALVGRVFLLISFPQQMTTWPVANGFETSYVDAQTGATPLYYLKQLIGLSNGSEAVDTANALPSLWDSLMGAMGGSLGEVCALALIIGGIFLIAMRVITWHIPVAIIATVALFAACVSWFGGVPNEAISTGSFVAYELLTGGLMLGAFFMATDYVTSPMTAWGKIIFGIGIGIIMMVIRLLGNYPEGMSFAILIMNACVPLLNKFRPQRFGEKRK